MILLTAKSDPDSRLAGLESGADAFVGKPFDRRELLSAARNLLALKEREVQLEAARRRAEEASHAKSAFLANMSHELRTPITAIIGYTEMIREEAELAPQLDADLRRVQTAANYLLQLVSDILDLSKVAAGQLDVASTEVALGDVLEEIVPLATSLCAKKGNRFQSSWPTELPAVIGDAVRLRQVLLNLLSNAAKFTEHGVVELQAGIDADGTWIAVSDTGIGIDESGQSRLFQPFVQVHGEGAAQFGGTGLGLSLSRQLARMMGGEVSVSSVKGEGSTFTVRLRSAGRPSARAG